MNLNLKKNFSIGAIVTAYATLALSLSSCRPETKEADNLRAGAVVIQGDKTKCVPTSPGTIITPNSPLVGIWDELNWSETDTLRFSSILEFRGAPNSANLAISFTNNCTIKSLMRSAVVSVTAIGIDRMTSFSVNEPVIKTVTDKIGGIDVTCDVRADAGNYVYNFDGNCLVIDGRYYIRH